MNISKPELVRMAKERGVRVPTTMNKAHLLKVLDIDLPPPTDSRVICCTVLRLALNPCPLTFVSESGDRRSFPSMTKAIRAMHFGARTIVRMRDDRVTHRGWTVETVRRRIPQRMIVDASSLVWTCAVGYSILERIGREGLMVEGFDDLHVSLHRLTVYFLHKLKVWLIERHLSGTTMIPLPRLMT